jgi:hypothetical protein
MKGVSGLPASTPSGHKADELATEAGAATEAILAEGLGEEPADSVVPEDMALDPVPVTRADTDPDAAAITSGQRDHNV